MRNQLQNLLANLPPIVARHDIEKYLGGLVSKGYLQNLDCKGEGPERIKVGRKVGYTREALVAWLESRSKQNKNFSKETIIWNLKSISRNRKKIPNSCK